MMEHIKDVLIHGMGGLIAALIVGLFVWGFNRYHFTEPVHSDVIQTESGTTNSESAEVYWFVATLTMLTAVTFAGLYILGYVTMFITDNIGFLP